MKYNARILIADESPASRVNIREGLLRAGYSNIDEAANGEEAVIKMKRSFPEVVILDVWLSKLDGIGVLRNARNTDWGDEKMPSFIVISSVANNNMFMRSSPSICKACVSTFKPSFLNAKPRFPPSLCRWLPSSKSPTLRRR